MIKLVVDDDGNSQKCCTKLGELCDVTPPGPVPPAPLSCLGLFDAASDEAIGNTLNVLGRCMNDA